MRNDGSRELLQWVCAYQGDDMWLTFLGNLARQCFIQQQQLTFLGFQLQPHVLHAYKQRYPQDLHATNLQNWIEFEQQPPDVFIGMYQFWVQKLSV